MSFASRCPPSRGAEDASPKLGSHISQSVPLIPLVWSPVHKLEVQGPRLHSAAPAGVMKDPLESGQIPSLGSANAFRNMDLQAPRAITNAVVGYCKIGGRVLVGSCAGACARTRHEVLGLVNDAGDDSPYHHGQLLRPNTLLCGRLAASHPKTICLHWMTCQSRLSNRRSFGHRLPYTNPDQTW